MLNNIQWESGEGFPHNRATASDCVKTGLLKCVIATASHRFRKKDKTCVWNSGTINSTIALRQFFNYAILGNIIIFNNCFPPCK